MGRKKWTKRHPHKFVSKFPTVIELLSRKRHLETYPWCTYEGAHFVGPSFGDVGFFLCERDNPNLEEPFVIRRSRPWVDEGRPQRWDETSD